MRVDATTYVWVRWIVDDGYSSWHQVPEDAVPRPLEGEGDVRYVLRLWTRCGFEVPDPQDIEKWSGSTTPPGQTCIYCTRSFLVGALPPLGTPPVPGQRRYVLRTGPRRKGLAAAPSATVEGTAAPAP